MGRLDDHTKRRIVELHRAGLSFRKIKKVLELDDIRVMPQAAYLFLKRKSEELGLAGAGWDGEQPWSPLRGREVELPVPPGARPRTGPGKGSVGSWMPYPTGGQDTKGGIQTVSVALLCKDSGQLRGALSEGLPTGNGDEGPTGAPSALAGLATPLQPLPVAAPIRSPALVVKKIIMDRATLQEKVKDASTQTALPNPMVPGNQNLAWGGAVPSPAPSSRALAEKLDAVQTEIQRLSQALHVVLERQCHLERQQEQQQRLQQEVLVTLQQLSSTMSHSTMPANQPCLPCSSLAKPSPTLPNFSQFKMELI